MAGPDLAFLKSQLATVPLTSTSFAGKTVIVTGSNTGLGLEAARHFASLSAKRVILAVRNIKAGEEAASSIHASTGRDSVCEVWEIDMGNWESIKRFLKRAEGLERLDAVVENAGIARGEWIEVEGWESTVAVNVIGTFLLAVGLLPVLRRSVTKNGGEGNLTIVSSEVHAWTPFDEQKEDSIFTALNKNNPEYMKSRYPTSKLLEVLMIRALASRINSGTHANEPIILNTVNPGLCKSSLTRDSKGLQWVMVSVLKMALARTTEAGSRTLVAGAAAGKESHGQYMDTCVVAEPSPFVRSEEGAKVQERVYEELVAILEEIQPGISKNI